MPIPPAYEALDGRYPGALLQHADEHSYGTEFLAYRMSIRTVGSLDEAVEHIARYSSRHSEAVVSENAGTIREFQQRVDAACVYANVSTAFTDGAQFGLGAEIGISTQKLHGPGADGSARADDIQVSDRRRRPDPRVMGADRFSARPS